MEDLIRQYKDGRKNLRDKAKSLKAHIQESDDTADLMDLKNDLSLINGMIRDMTDVIGLMSSPHHKIRGEKNVITMDPHLISAMDLSEKEWDPDNEETIRSKVLDEFETLMRSRMQLLTNKQKSTLHRWIYGGQSLSEIAVDDGVSRQAVWDRIFGNKSHSGALRKLRGGE